MQVGVLQFSNDVHIHLPLTHLNMDTCVGITTNMVRRLQSLPCNITFWCMRSLMFASLLQERMQGGTDVAYAIQIASDHMQTAMPGKGLKTLVILSDGRIDRNQGSFHS